MRHSYNLSDSTGRVQRVYVHVEDGVGRVFLAGDYMEITDKLTDKERRRLTKRFKCVFHANTKVN